MKSVIVHTDHLEILLREPIGADYPSTLCAFRLDAAPRGQRVPERVVVDGADVPWQWQEDAGTVWVRVALARFDTTRIQVWLGRGTAVRPASAPARIAEVDGGTVVRLAQGELKLPPLGERVFDPSADSFLVPAPIQAVRLAGHLWRGQGYLDTRLAVTDMSCRVVESGPLFDTVEIVYHLAGSRHFRFRCTAVAGENWARISEEGDLGPKSRWWLDFGPDWLPDQVTLLDHSLAYTQRRLTYFKDTLEARLFYWTQATQICGLREGLGFHHSGAPEYVAWFAARGNDWQGFKTNFIEFWQRRMRAGEPLTKGEETFGSNWDWMPPAERIPAQGGSVYDGHLTAESMLVSGTKHYGLVVADKADFLYTGEIPAHDLEWYSGPLRYEEWKRLRSPLRSLAIHQGLLPLDMVKEWTLDFNAGIEAAGGVDRTHAVFENRLKADERAVDLRPAARQLQERMLEYVTMQAAGYLVCRGPGSTNPVTLRNVAPYAFLFRDLLRLGLLDEAVRLRLQAGFAFLGHLTSQPFFYPAHCTMAAYDDPQSSEPTALGMPNQNFLTDVYATHGAVGLVMPGHPLAAPWVERFDRLVGRQLDFYMYPESGVWEESHTYFHHVLFTLLLPFFEEKLGGRRNWFADKRFQKLAGALLHVLTPPDPNLGARTMAPLGDHAAQTGMATPDTLALGFADTAPELAAALAWMAQETGWKGTPAVKPVRPRLTTGIVQGLAGVFRHEDSAGESLVILRAGASWGHHNNDELSLHYYSAGEPVLVEAGYGMPKHFSKHDPSGHSLLAPLEFVPLCYLGKQNRGRIEACRMEAPPWFMRGTKLVSAMHAVRRDTNPAWPIDVWPYEQVRELHFLPPGLLIVHDRHDGPYAQQLFWHTGGQEMTADGNRLRIRGHRRDTLLVTFADTAYEVAADHKTFGACGRIGLARDIITALVTVSAGEAFPALDLSGNTLCLNGVAVWHRA